MAVEVRLLGDVDVRVDGRPVDIGHSKQTYVLAALAADAGRCVAPDDLVERIYGDDPPRRAKETTRVYLCKLRQAIEPWDAAIIRQPAGYMLAVDPLAVDLHRFRHLVATARGGAEATAQVAYDAALRLWRGRPIGSLDTPWSAQLRSELARERQSAERDHIDLLLACGRHAEAIPPLTAQAGADPFDERLAGQLILALYRGDRRADAMAHYERVRRLLSEELGIDPGASLQRLYQRMLRTDASLTEPGPRSGTARRLAVPRQLPPLPAAFSGRTGMLSRLDAALLSGADGRAARVAMIHGPGGVGKTWLALRWAHDNAHRFTDGQLYVNLRGFDPGREPLPPEAAVRGILYGLGVTAAALPPDPDSQVALYRSLVSGRRILLLLDDARTSEQVESLLPGTASCATLITSRTGLAGLVAGHSARPVPLGMVDDAEAAQVLAGHLGAHRLAGEPEAAAELVHRCAGLSLALGIAAGRALLAPELPLAALAADLRESSARLDGFETGEVRGSLRAVLAASLDAVRPAAAELFSRLGAAPGPDIALDAARHLTDSARTELMPSLRELVDGHLVQEHRAGRYRMHDLVRRYAAEINGDPAPVRDRMLDYYAAAALAADRALDPGRERPPGVAPAAGPAAAVFTGQADAVLWFEQEHQVLLSCVAQAAEHGADPRVLALVWAMTTYLERRGGWHDRAALQEAAVRSAIRLGDPGTEADARRGLATARIWLEAYDDATEQLRIAGRLFEAAGDRAGLAATHRSSARVFARQHRHADALVHDERALALFQQAEHLAGQATALNAIGWHHAHLGRPDAAIDYGRRALAIHERLGNRFGQALTWDTIGAAYSARADLGNATTHFRLAAATFRSCGHRYQEADTLRRLGTVLLDAGAVSDGCAAWQRAAVILDDLGHPEGDEVRRQLTEARRLN